MSRLTSVASISRGSQSSILRKPRLNEPSEERRADERRLAAAPRLRRRGRDFMVLFLGCDGDVRPSRRAPRQVHCNFESQKRQAFVRVQLTGRFGANAF
jgi:hypothetical protein